MLLVRMTCPFVSREGYILWGVSHPPVFILFASVWVLLLRCRALDLSPREKEAPMGSILELLIGAFLHFLLPGICAGFHASLKPQR